MCPSLLQRTKLPQSVIFQLKHILPKGKQASGYFMAAVYLFFLASRFYASLHIHYAVLQRRNCPATNETWLSLRVSSQGIKNFTDPTRTVLCVVRQITPFVTADSAVHARCVCTTFSPPRRIKHQPDFFVIFRRSRLHITQARSTCMLPSSISYFFLKFYTSYTRSYLSSLHLGN